MTHEQSLTLIREALGEVEPTRSEVWATLPLDTPIEALGLDSVRLMEMVGALEEAADTTFPDEALQGLQSLTDLAELLKDA